MKRLLGTVAVGILAGHPASDPGTRYAAYTQHLEREVAWHLGDHAHGTVKWNHVKLVYVNACLANHATAPYSSCGSDA